VDLVDDRLLEVEGHASILQSAVPPQALVLSKSGKPTAILTPQGQSTPITRSRPTQRRVVKCATISGVAILEGNDDLTEGALWPGQNIPIIPVIGDEIDINGKVDLRGIVRDAKDPQRRYNFNVTADTEAQALVPKSPIIAADGQMEGYEDIWRQANVKNYAYLPYKALSLDGHLVSEPHRLGGGAGFGSSGMLTQQADNDLKAVTGFYEASLGQSGPEQSGKAILARQRQGDIGSFNYQDNLALAIATVGRYLVDLIPKIYDAPRIERILGPDDRQKTVMVHAGQPPEEQPEGVAGVYDLSAGTYDVTVSVGPSYQSRRQEAVAAMTQFVQAFPPAFPMIGDLLAQHMDWPGAVQIADRLKKALPAQFQDEGPDGQPKQAEPPPEMVQQMQQMNAAIEQMTAELQEKTQALASKQVEAQSAEKIAQMEIDSREKIAEMQYQAALAKVQGAIDQKNIELQNTGDVDVAQIETDSRERIAELNTAADLAKTEQKIDGSLDLAALKTHLAALTAALGMGTSASTPSDRAGTNDGV
jgi:hypothetical protein